MNSQPKHGTKEKVLAILNKQSGGRVSGEELARSLGVSRASVWKAVSALKDEGYNIDAKRNAGYLLLPGNVLSREIIGGFLKDTSIKEKIEVYSSVTSTNNVAKQYAAEHTGKRQEPLEKVIIADSQTAGRGRRGRSFFSPPGSGVYMSFLLRPNVGASDAVKFTTAASVAVCEAVENAFSLKPEIKWVNDVYLNGRKICGILTESVTDIETGDVDSLVIGIGVNVFKSDLPSELQGIVGTLEGSDLDRNRLIAEIINSLTGMLEIKDGRALLKSCISEYKRRSMVLGRNIKILNTGEIAAAIDIDENGGLIVRTADGTKTLSSGEISIRLDEQRGET